jgi:hypothetical protein
VETNWWMGSQRASESPPKRSLDGAPLRAETRASLGQPQSQARPDFVTGGDSYWLPVELDLQSACYCKTVLSN